MKKNYLKRETESTIVAAADQTLCASQIRNVVYGENSHSICFVCDIADETVAQFLPECSKLSDRVQASETWQHCQNDTLETIWKMGI